MTHEGAGQLAHSAARLAVRETFKLFGLDIDDQDAVNAFRADLIYARRLRKMSDGASNITFKIIVGSIVVGISSLMFDSLKLGIREFFHWPW